MIKTLELVLLPQEAADKTAQLEQASNLLAVSQDRLKILIKKKSIDARGKTVRIRLSAEIFIDEDLPPSEDLSTFFHYHSVRSNANPVLIIGCGPAGMFAALRLIEKGFKPIVIERGKDVRSRRRDLATLNKSGIVDPNSNYCFGEGGAGTYSDGKLYTRSGKRGDINRILNNFVLHGADSSILIDAHPHIGTNKLPGIVQRMRQTILDCGGEIHFETHLTDLIIQEGAIKGAIVKNLQHGDSTEMPASNVILATGHSARDIYRLLDKKEIAIETKPFALGVRIEHPQSIIDSVQYHCTSRSPFLPPASYSLTTQAEGRGVYSFCMCPGGIIAAAATAPGEIVVNGWSPSKRNNKFANSGMVVSIHQQDYDSAFQPGTLAGLSFQETIEKNCFKAGGGNLVAPAQRLMDFLHMRVSADLPDCSYTPGITSVPIDQVLPMAVTTALRIGLKEFGKRMKPYLTNEAVLVSTESRTSSPVRIPRDPITLQHPAIKGLFPCGEGAGYAGGIVSAAIDGERCANAIT